MSPLESQFAPRGLSLAAIATRLALFAADLASAPWLGHVRLSFHFWSPKVSLYRSLRIVQRAPIAFIVACLLASCASAAPTTRPNIILILADDMGFSDIGCFGGEIQTPNIDRLAREGVRFTQFYNMSRCCPTRAALLTGLYPQQTGVGAMCQDLGLPSYRGQLNDRCATLAELLGASGYHTAIIGKWHLANLTIGNNNRDSKRILNFEIPAPISPSTESWPTRRGFDTHTGTIAGVGSYFDPWSLVHDLTPITPPDLKGFYYTDFITETACKTITDSANAKNPFFLYVAYTAPHWPMQARESDIARYADTYKVGWDELRQRRYRRLMELGIIKPTWPLSPRPTEAHGVTIRSWSDAPNKDWEARRMAVYAAMIDRMDQGIGRLIETLSANHLDDNTLVIFLSDNGGCAEVVQRNWYDIPTKTRDGRPIAVGNDPHVMPGDETTFQSVGPAWANASNTPFRRFKHFTEEGGISTPLIVRWPGKVDRAGALEPAVGHVIDLVPTCLEAASVSYPTSLKGRDLTPLAGMSLWPAIRGQPMSGRPLFWEHEGNRAVRVGPWKLLAAHQEPWQLYDLESDRTESHDLATEHPEKTAELRQLYDAWAHRIGVAPWPIKPATQPSTESLPLSPRAERQGEG